MQRIEIDNFMALKKATIELRSLLLLLGEQASGKSTISKLIYYFKSVPQDLLYVIGFEKSLPLAPSFHKQLTNRFFDFFGTITDLPKFEIRYFYTEQHYIQLSHTPHIEKSFNIFISEQNELLEQCAQLKAKISNHWLTPYEQAERVRAVKDLEQFVMGWFANEREPVFVPAGRSPTINYPEGFQMDLSGLLRNGFLQLETQPNLGTFPIDLRLIYQFLNHTEIIKQRFIGHTFQNLVKDQVARGNPVNRSLLDKVEKKIEKILKGNYQHDQQGEKIFYAEQEYVLLTRASSGQQEAIRIVQDIFLILLDQQKAFRVIEEPEAHLYPMAQKHLIELIVLLLNQSNSQVIITTHSPYILSILNNLLYAGRLANQQPAHSQEINTIIESDYWLETNKSAVYFLRDGQSQSIMDQETGLIGQNFLDEISEELGAEFDQLYRLGAKSRR